MRRRLPPLLLVAALASMLAACGSSAPASSPAPAAPSGSTSGTAARPPASTASTPPASPATASSTVPAGSAVEPLQHVSLLLDWIVSGYHAPYYAGVAKGYYRAEGIDLTIVPGKGSVSTAQQVGTGNYDFGLADVSVAANAISKGVPILVVADWFQKSPDGLIYLASSHLTKPSDYIGRTVAYTPSGASADLFQAFEAANHIQPGQIKVLTASPEDLPAVLAEKKVAAVSDFGTDVVPALALKGVKADVLYYADAGVPVLSTGLLVNDAYLKAHPGVVRGMVAATQKAWEFASRHPNQAIALERQAAPDLGAEATAQLTLSLPLLHLPDTANDPIGWMSAGDWTRTLDILHEYEGVETIKPAADYYTDRFVPRG